MKNEYRQKLHFEPKSGWINDPNGLCFFRGAYHVYYQYSPDSALGEGRKCWGHMESPDLIHWRVTGIVLFPDSPDDRDGVFSGSGLVKDDRLYLFYTGNVMEEGEHDYTTSGRGANVILVTTEDGRKMSGKKTLLRNCDYPDDCSCHVRDPKVWEENGRYFMVLGARTLDDRGCVLKYVSEDMEHWEYLGRYFCEDMGYMWECPDEFTLGGHRFLSVSPQGLAHGKYTAQNVYSSGYFDMDGGVPAGFEEWDKGFDFYAPQTFSAPGGRRILIGWEGIGDIPYSNPTVKLGRQHCLTLPRELSLSEDGKLRQMPVRELEKLRKQSTPVKSGDIVRTRLPFELEGTICDGFSAEIGGVLRLDYRGDEFSLEFLSESAGGGRTVRYALIKDCRDIRMIADTSSAEIYLGGGRAVMSARMYPDDTEVTLSVSGCDGRLYQLDGMEIVFDK